MSDDIVDFLGKSRLFSGFSLEQLEQVVSHLQPQSIIYPQRQYKRTFQDATGCRVNVFSTTRLQAKERLRFLQCPNLWGSIRLLVPWWIP